MASLNSRRLEVICRHLVVPTPSHDLETSPCAAYVAPELNEGPPKFSTSAMRHVLFGECGRVYDRVLAFAEKHPLFWTNPYPPAGHLFTGTDYDKTKRDQRELTFERILNLRDAGFFEGWMTSRSIDSMRESLAISEALGMLDHSLSIKTGVHFRLWGNAILYLGTKRHHDQWAKKTETYEVAGCFALTELGHGSNVRGIETVATYSPSSQEFTITTPCETAQKYWIGGAALHANHTVAFAQLHINGRNEGVHAFIVQLRDSQGCPMPGIRIADCGHKTGLNGVDNGRIWFDSVRIPRENLLNAVADVTSDGRYMSSIKDPEQRFAAFMAPLTGGRVSLAAASVIQAMMGLTIAIRYSLSRRAFAPSPGLPETLLLDYPTHQRRLLPLLAKTYALSFATTDLRELYLRRKPSDAKLIHVLSSGFKAMASWHMLRTLQECREAVGGMGYKTANRVGYMRTDHDIEATFEGDNVVLMQTVSKAVFDAFASAASKGRPVGGLGLEFLNAAAAPVSASADRSVIRDPQFLLAVFQARERDLLGRLQAAVASSVRSGMSVNDAMNENSQLCTDLGRADTELKVLLASQRGAEQAPAACKDILALLSTLSALVIVDEDTVFLRYGYLNAKQGEAIHREIAALCKELRPHALALVQSFGFPRHILGPIAADWVDYESWHNAEGRCQ